MVTVITTTVTCSAVASPRQPNRKVWRNFVDNSGWNNKGMVSLTGLVNPNYGIAGLDGAIHLAVDCFNATKVVPFAVVFSVITRAIIALFFVVAMQYRIGDIEAVLTSSTVQDSSMHESVSL